MATATTPLSVGTERVPFVDLVAQYESIAADLDQAALGVLRRADAILGKEVELFEGEFADYCDAPHAVAVDSGTSALELALRAFGVGPGDEVITVANSFIATALAVSYTGARPVLVDADPSTSTIDVSQVERAITDRTRAIMPVHLYGHPADMDPLLEIARRHSLVVIEDACQAHGARYKGRRVGTLGDAAAFSFYPAKNLGACGDGGIVVTTHKRAVQMLRMLRNYGQAAKYHHLLKGFNRRLDTMQAAILRVKLRHLDRWNQARREHAALYSRLLQTTGLALPVEARYAESVYHLYPVRTKDRDRLRAWLGDQGIDTGIHYPVPIHLQLAYRDLGHGPGSFPVAEAQALETVSLPMYPELVEMSIRQVADAVATFVGVQSAPAQLAQRAA